MGCKRKLGKVENYPEDDLRRAARAVDSLVGIPWEKMRIMLLLLRLSSPTGEPTMSFAFG